MGRLLVLLQYYYQAHLIIWIWWALGPHQALISIELLLGPGWEIIEQQRAPPPPSPLSQFTRIVSQKDAVFVFHCASPLMLKVLCNQFNVLLSKLIKKINERPFIPVLQIWNKSFQLRIFLVPDSDPDPTYMI